LTKRLLKLEFKTFALWDGLSFKKNNGPRSIWALKKNLQQVQINVDLEPIASYQLIGLLKEFKDIFA
jgi:hypothetical protein